MDGKRPAEVDGPSTNVLCEERRGEKKIRPIVGEGSIEKIVQNVYGFTVTEIKELVSYFDRNYFIQVVPHGRHSRQPHPDGYLVKIYSKQSMNPTGIDAQHEMMSCLIQNNIPAQVPVQTLNGHLYSLQVINADAEGRGTTGEHLVELRKFIPGRIIKEVPHTPNLMYQDGRLIANMTRAWKDFHNSHLKTTDPTNNLWSLMSVPKLTTYTFCLGNEERSLIEDIVSTFNTRVVSQYEHLPRGYVHGDVNEQNILVSRNASGDDYDVCGILDLADAEYSFPVIDIAENIAYMMIDSQVTDQMDIPGYVLVGYLSVRPLTQVEWDVLVPCVAGRLAQSLTLGLAQYLDTKNTYVLTTAEKGWPLLKKFWAESEKEMLSRWKTIISNYK